MRVTRWFALLPLVCLSASAEVAVGDLIERKLLDRIHTFDQSLDGALGMAVIDLTTGHSFSYNGDAVFPQASSIKIPIMIQMFRSIRAGEFSLSDKITLTPEETVGGSGHLQKELAKGPLTLTVRELMTAMIETSDNTATNKCIRMARMERVNRTLDEMGFLNTRLRRIMIDTAAARRNEENVSTPLEMVRLVETIYRGKAVDAEASAQMIEIMKLVKASFRKAVPAAVVTFSKPGGVPGVQCESGVILLPGRPFALSVMSTYIQGDAGPVAEVTGMVYRHFEKLALANRYGHKTE